MLCTTQLVWCNYLFIYVRIRSFPDCSLWYELDRFAIIFVHYIMHWIQFFIKRVLVVFDNDHETSHTIGILYLLVVTSSNSYTIYPFSIHSSSIYSAMEWSTFCIRNWDIVYKSNKLVKVQRMHKAAKKSKYTWNE